MAIIEIMCGYRSFWWQRDARWMLTVCYGKRLRWEIRRRRQMRSVSAIINLFSHMKQ